MFLEISLQRNLNFLYNTTLIKTMNSIFTVNGLTDGSTWAFLVGQVAVYVSLRFLQGGGFSGGALNGIRSFMWIKVQQYTNRRVQVDFQYIFFIFLVFLYLRNCRFQETYI